MNDLLSLCIQTHNHAEELNDCLKNLIPQAKKHDLPVYISDNASADHTEEMVVAAQKNYPRIYYSRNQENLGPDRNTERVLKMSQTEYAWLFGDRSRLVEGAIDKVLTKLRKDHCDLLIVNYSPERVKDVVGPALYTGPVKLLSDLGWHMTQISCLVWSRSLIDGSDFKRYYRTNFIHIGSIFGYFKDHPCSVYWLADPLVYGSKSLSGWGGERFEIFARKWFEIIRSLPSSYPDEIKNKCLKDHGVKSGLFSWVGFLKAKGLGYYDPEIYKKYAGYLPYITKVNPLLLYLLAMIPLPMRLVRFLRKIRLAQRGG